MLKTFYFWLLGCTVLWLRMIFTFLQILNIIRIFVILKKIYSDNARGFLLIASHLLQYIGEDKKSSPLFSPLFSRIYRRERKNTFFLFPAPTLVLKVGILVTCLLCSHYFAAKRTDLLGLKEYHLSTSFAGRSSASKIRFFLRLSFSAYRPAKIFLYSNFL